MDKKSKILFISLSILIIVSIGVTYYRTMISKDYEVFYDDYGESELDEESEVIPE